MDENSNHLVMDIYTKEEIINKPKELKMMLYKAVELSGNKPLDIVEHIFEPQGYTVIILLSESHISLHTYPENNYLAIDLYACGKGDPMKALEFMLSVLKPYKKQMLLMKRGSKTIVLELFELQSKIYFSDPNKIRF